MENLDIEVMDYFWPAVLIVVGLGFIYAARKRGRSNGQEFRVIGNIDHPRFSGDIDGTELTTMIGDVKVEFPVARLKAGINRVDISFLVGDVELTIPPEVAYAVACSGLVTELHLPDRKRSSIFGTIIEKSPGYDGAERKINVHCNGLIGDVKIIPEN